MGKEKSLKFNFLNKTLVFSKIKHMNNSDLIKEFIDKKVIDALDLLLSSDDINEISNSAKTIAALFGTDFENFSSDDKKLIASFKKNLSLLIQKTWVEESDVLQKESVLTRLEKFCALAEQEKWAEGFASFKQILNSVIYLMFGSICKTPEFEEYSLRIDPEFGIFCWYVKNLPDINSWANEKNKAAILVAMYFLSNY